VLVEEAVAVSAGGPLRDERPQASSQSDARPHANTSVPFDAVLVFVWLLGAAIGAGTLLIGLGHLWWVAVRARPIARGRWPDIAREVADRYGLRQSVVLLQSQHPVLLVTWGIFRPKVILPQGAATWPEERIRVVLSHELAHIQRADWLVQLIVQILRSAYWFNPLMWIACRRLRQESEQACDDAVLNLGVDASAYATHLVELARTFRNRRMWSPAPAIARPSSLERRVSAMLNARLNRAPLSRQASVLALLALLAVALPVAGFNASAQTFSTLSGTVVDSQGGLLPNVTMVLTNAGTGSKYEVRTNGTGQFEFVGLPAADYRLEAKVPGFRTFSEPLTVVNRNLIRDITLQVGELEETITVTAGPGRPSTPEIEAQRLAETEKARISFQRAAAACNPSATTTGPAIGGSIKPPLKIRHVPPQYPDSLKVAGIGGNVLMNARIGTDGRVREVRPTDDPAVHPGLVAAAMVAVNEWEFTQTLLNCVPIEVSMKVNVWFNPAQ
jgi:beta-lactamase regulating signal transducer with metallopeptidase domain